MRELLRLKKYLLRYKFHYLIGIIALIIIDLLQLLIPRVLKAAIDGLATGIADFSKLGVYFIIIILIAIGIAIGRFFWRYLLIGSSRKIERLLRTDFYSHLVTLDFTYFDVHKTGDLMAHAVNDINAVRMALGFGFIILVDVVILGIASLVMMVNISPRLTMYALIPFPLIAIFSTRFAGLIHHLFEKVQEAFAFLTERVRENLAGIRIVKLFVQEGGEIKKFQDLSQEYVEKNKRLIKIWGMFFPLIILLGMIGQVIVIWLGGRYVILGQISIGSFVAFIAYLQILVWPMMAIGWTINLFQRGSASQRRLNRIFNVQPDIKDGTVETELSGAIEFKDVSFIYQGKDIPALSQISFNIEPREFLGITGPVASGKTSLVNLILRFYEPTEGQILLDGYDIKELKQKSIRQNIAYVPQDTFLFSDTIRNNILLGKSDA
ncbi:MAG TPA: ABC transporter ATP-binding protein, partial [bacterium (Candidatus Stahlbacteria)]|nr:ABC transporter ATP-binding protein [Candidatus Stahlbacteria bacterium]